MCLSIRMLKTVALFSFTLNSELNLVSTSWTAPLSDAFRHLVARQQNTVHLSPQHRGGGQQSLIPESPLCCAERVHKQTAWKSFQGFLKEPDISPVFWNQENTSCLRSGFLP